MSKVKIIPCSGVGKVYGLMSREIAIAACDKDADLVCLAHLVTGEDDAKEKIKDAACITIDGCAKMCAAKSTEALGGDVQKQYRVINGMKDYRDLKPGNATRLTDEGWQIVDDMAKGIKAKVQEILGGEE